MNVEDVIRIRIAEAARKIEAARRRRAELDTARQAGLPQRHAAKLRHLAETAQAGPPESDRPCAPRACARDDGACYQTARPAAADSTAEVA